MRTFKIKRVYLAKNKNRKGKKGKIIPKDEKSAKKAILEYIAEAIGGVIDIEKGTITTDVNLGKNFSCLHKLGCTAELSQVRKSTV